MPAEFEGKLKEREIPFTSRKGDVTRVPSTPEILQ